jgi:hypothetical protein
MKTKDETLELIDNRSARVRELGILQSRAMDVVLDAMTRADGTTDDRIPIALSSEAGVQRFDWREGDFYLEILDHSPGAVDLSYARDGLPFLLNHDTADQIGLIEDIAVDKDRKLRGMVRFSSSPGRNRSSATCSTESEKRCPSVIGSQPNTTRKKVRTAS